MPTDIDPSGLAALDELVADGLEIATVVHDSRAVTPGSLYACLRGEHFDGHDFAARAVGAGAVALLTDHLVGGVGPVAQIVVDDTRTRLGPIAARLAGNPSRDLATIGVTGTNGKTTTAALLHAIFERAGRSCGVIGTLHGPRTTPEAPELQARLRSFVDEGRTAAVLEVSSHALELYRVDGTVFDAVVFTNLGHDHLDLHGSQEAYFRAKARLFTSGFSSLGIINVDDPYGRLLADTVADDDFRVVPYTVTELTDVDVTARSHRYTWRGRLVEVPLGGEFNVANSLAALTTAVELGIDPDDAIAGLADAGVVPGRFEVVETEGSSRPDLTVLVDYAHTPDGLAGVLASARAVAPPGGSVTVVFGCGGDRDREKRPEMGAEAARGADRVIITSDNPRTESPEAIIAAVVDGIPASARPRVDTVVDRRDAIRLAIESAQPGDVVVIAGKGHEATQEFADRTVAFDDREVVREILAATR